MSISSKILLALAVSLVGTTPFLNAAAIIIEYVDGSVTTAVSLNDDALYEADGTIKYVEGAALVSTNANTEVGTFDDGAGDSDSNDYQLYEIPVLSKGGIDYFAFVLDAREPSSSVANKTFTIADVTLSVSSDNTYSSLTEVWTNTNAIQLNGFEADGTTVQNTTDTPSANGGDFLLLIPVSAFASHSTVEYLEFKYTQSNAGGSGGGAEEWTLYGGRGATYLEIPEPSSSALMVLASGCMLMRRRR